MRNAAAGAIWPALTQVRELLTAPDAACLALAARRGLGLATVDQQLRRACGRAGVDLVD